MILSNGDQIIIANNTALTNAENRTLPIAMENNPVTKASGTDFRFCSFGVISQLAWTLVCERAMLGSFATVETVFSLPVLANTYTETWALPAPLGQDGYILINGPYVRFRAVDTAAANHTFTRIFIRLWS